MNLPNIYVLPQNNVLRSIHTKLRNIDTERAEFVFNANRIIRLLLEKSLEFMPYQERSVVTPVGATYQGTQISAPITAVSVVRSGESMEYELASLMPNISIGKILIQRDKISKLPLLIYASLPEEIEKSFIFVMEPMLATGGSAVMAIEVLLGKGVREENIIFVNILASPEGLSKLSDKYPRIQIVTSSIESGLNTDAYMLPGIGDFGDRYFGTTIQRKNIE